MRWFVTGGSGFVGGALIAHLTARGDEVRALARSDRSAAAVEALGATAVRGDLLDVDALTAGMENAQVVVHLAAETDLRRPHEDFRASNVEGTRSVVRAARAAEVPALIHMSTEAVLAEGAALSHVDEGHPLATEPAGIYTETKRDAERIALDAAGALRVVVLRPRFVWGPGDTTVLPELVAAVEGGRFAWPGGGRFHTSTTHVENLVAAIVLVAESPQAEGVYFVADDGTVSFREFISDLLGTRDIPPPTRSVPIPALRLAARAGEPLWRLLRRPGKPPLTRQEVALMFVEVTVDDTRIRAELGFRPVIGRSEGIDQLRHAGGAPGPAAAAP
jgi:nucleoside-diphosphate-sugar epimerase